VDGGINSTYHPKRKRTSMAKYRAVGTYYVSYRDEYQEPIEASDADQAMDIFEQQQEADINTDNYITIAGELVDHSFEYIIEKVED
jgi:hypothetical protein